MLRHKARESIVQNTTVVWTFVSVLPCASHCQLVTIFVRDKMKWNGCTLKKIYIFFSISWYKHCSSHMKLKESGASRDQISLEDCWHCKEVMCTPWPQHQPKCLFCFLGQFSWALARQGSSGSILLPLQTPEIHLMDSQCPYSHDTSSIPGGEVVTQLMASQFFLFPCSSSLLCCLCSWSCVYMVTNLVALSQLNKSLSVYRVPHSTHARQEFTMMCLRRKYIQMFMRHHPICGLFWDKGLLMSSYFI